VNNLQKIIIESLIHHSIDMKHFVKDVKNTFTINTLCDMLKINRNRYNYLNSTEELDSFIFHNIMDQLHEWVGEDHEQV